MRFKKRKVPKGSWRWALRIAELTAWGTVAVVAASLATADLPESTQRTGYVVTGVLGVWLVILFHLLLPRLEGKRWLLGVSVVVNLGFAAAIFWLLDDRIGSMELVFVPVIVATGLLGRLPETLLAPVVAVGAVAGLQVMDGGTPEPGPLVVTGGVFLLSGLVSALPARQLRRHYRAELQEHRLATAVRHRLMAVVDAVDQAIVFIDRGGVVRVVNRRAADLFHVDPDDYLGLPGVQLRRTMARKTEDPEGFMETFQELRDDPERELRTGIEQIIPARRQLRLFSSPAFDETGILVGRIDVYTDVTENTERAVEMQRLYDQARHTAESYQRSLLPDSVPTLPRFNLVAHYVPAAGRRAVCGDFYDFLTWPDGRAGVVLGDVSGVGPVAVGDGSLARYSLESFAGTESDAGRLMEMMNAHLYGRVPSERFVRLMLGILDPERAVFEYANAGHVPPVIYHCRSGEVEWLGEGGMALAVEEDARYKVGRVELEPGDMLVLYTDGVTEAPRHGRPFGQGRFMDLVEAYGKGTPGEMSQAIRRSVDAWVEDGELRDDLVVLVCQVVPDSFIGEPTRELVLPNEASRLREIRAFVRDYLADIRAPVDVASEIVIASGEAAGNACKYGRRPDARSELRVRCAVEGKTVEVVIADDGPGFEAGRTRGGRLPDRFAAGGRGLFLIHELMDRVSIESSDEGTTVSLAKRVP
jgi:serine phosphatase RsbU (regulator of sigma subunit)/anti-sigma regulatory factor (Ser/Thr protein kinase)/PAS domain-containing protein